MVLLHQKNQKGHLASAPVVDWDPGKTKQETSFRDAPPPPGSGLAWRPAKGSSCSTKIDCLPTKIAIHFLPLGSLAAQRGLSGLSDLAVSQSAMGSPLGGGRRILPTLPAPAPVARWQDGKMAGKHGNKRDGSRKPTSQPARLFLLEVAVGCNMVAWWMRARGTDDRPAASFPMPNTRAVPRK